MKVINGISGCGFPLAKDYFMIRPRSGKVDGFRRNPAMHQAFGMKWFEQLRNPESEPPDQLPRQGADTPGELLQTFPCFR